MTSQPLCGGVEAGGTKFVCAVGTGPDDLRSEVRLPTTTPHETIARAIEFFHRAGQDHGPLSAIGVASFGPIDPNRRSPAWGCITTTPKPGWAHTNLAGPLAQALRVPVGFDTDVNAAALAEWRWGAGRQVASLVYITVGTGIGGGAIVNGQTLHGLIHPEMGHLRIPHDRTADPFGGVCPYHGDCLEGLASGPALAARWGMPAPSLPANHPAWPLEARYLALAVQNIICTLSPERIVLGGGVMEQPALWPLVRQDVVELLAGYVQSPAILERIDEYLVPPGLGNRSGVLGGIALAQQALAG